MKKASVDFGTSLIKAVWKDNGDYKFFSTADHSLEKIVEEMKSAGIKKLCLSGINYFKASYNWLKDFELRVKQGDPIENEIALQAEGVKKLLNIEGHSLTEFLIISLGTGTSYTLLTKEGTKKFCLGNSIGGGFIRGLSKILGEECYNNMASTAKTGKPVDLCVKDMIPEKEGSLEGEFVVANFGKGEKSSKKEDIYSSIMSTVAVTTIRDVMLINMIPGFTVPENIVYIGSTVSKNPVLKEFLQGYSTLIGKKPYFPEYGEFALALGAYHMRSSVRLTKD